MTGWKGFKWPVTSLSHGNSVAVTRMDSGLDCEGVSRGEGVKSHSGGHGAGAGRVSPSSPLMGSVMGVGVVSWAGLAWFLGVGEGVPVLVCLK